MIHQHPTLYSRNTSGSIQLWWAESEGDHYRTCYGQDGGKIATTAWTYCKGKNSGKANQTTDSDQTIKEVRSLYKKQLKSNYFENIEDVDRGFKEPQLAKPCKDFIDDVKWERRPIVDHKLNGFACIITRGGAYSRNNEPYFNIDHIIEELKPFFDKYPDAYLHGELFNPQFVTELNEIGKLVAVTRRDKDITPELRDKSRRMVKLYLYDGYGFNGCVQESTGRQRRSALLDMLNEWKFQYIASVNFIVCTSYDEMEKFAQEYISHGGEGVIIRNPDAPYQHKRTKDLLKFKKFEDAEFEVISVEEGSGNWAGYAKYAWCRLPNGKKFKTNIKGGREHQEQILMNRDEYRGKFITVRFQEYSPYGVPLIPYTDMTVRKDIEG